MANQKHNIVVEIAVLSEIIASSEGEITPEIEALMKEVSRQIGDQTDFDGQFLNRLTRDAAFYRNEAKANAEKARRLEGAIERSKERIKAFMRSANVKRVEGARYGFALRKLRPKTEINEDIFPSYDQRPDLWIEKVEHQINRECVLKRVTTGEVINGVELREVWGLTPIDVIPEEEI